ncbi:syntaxin [Thecamonas trahens ATCC 50062]|uniref:Syntaxin n=1 Tax=Thecamonas trahens ATCC 50062 TaxID=461836 RepID=A0A0L0D952_THETB|nr:syntaxin [Thecamonas trahens ATCC 50062]KNC48566.1 syntaxin [Thecamonas trahens ATCC 50062]|eukprot:XP_013762622.1 syntaxin [Thecamonas trahens ATCC 50062]
MSFDDLERGTGRVVLGGGGGSGQQGGYGYQSGMAASGSMSNTSSLQYDQLHNQAVASITKISNNVAALQKMVNQLGTKRETPDMHARMTTLTERTRDLAREAGRLLKQITLVPTSSPAETQQRSVTQRKLGSDLKKQLTAFTAVQTRIKDADRRSIDTAKQSMAFGDAAGTSTADDQTQPLLAQQQTITLDSTIEFNEVLIAEREHDIAEIEATISDVNEIFRDLSTLVNEQGEQLHDIEHHIENTVAHTDGAVKELTKADNYQRKARRKAMCLALIFALIAGGVVLYLTQKK